MMIKKIVSPLILGALLFTLSCSGEGLFYQIQNEELIIDNSLPNIKFLDVHDTNPTGGGYYIARGRTLWYRTKSSSSWTKIPLPSGVDAITSSAMYDGSLYYTTTSGDSAALYRINTAATPTQGNQVFSRNPSGGDKVVLSLFGNEYSDHTVGGGYDQDRLFLNTVEYTEGNPVSSLLGYQEAGVTSPITAFADFDSCGSAVLGNRPLPVNGIAFGADADNANTSNGIAWLIYNDGSDDTAGGKCYSSNSNFTADSTPESPTGGYYNAIYTVDDGAGADVATLISVRTGEASYSLAYNDGSWKSTAASSLFSSFVNIDSYKTNKVLAGSVNRDTTSYSSGYHIIDTSSFSVAEENSTVADFDNYNSSDLKNSSIYGFCFDPNNNAILAAASLGPADGGIWYFSDSAGKWVHE